MRGAVGPAWANIAALAITAVANTAANRRFTFGVRGRRHLSAITSRGARLPAHGRPVHRRARGPARPGPQPGRGVELTVLVAASLVATVTRYIGLKTWVFACSQRHRPAAALAAAAASPPGE